MYNAYTALFFNEARMPSFADKLQDCLVPAALGAMIYFLQSLAKDSNELAKTVAVMARHQEDFEGIMARKQAEHERRLDFLEAQRRATRSGPR